MVVIFSSKDIAMSLDSPSFGAINDWSQALHFLQFPIVSSLPNSRYSANTGLVDLSPLFVFKRSQPHLSRLRCRLNCTSIRDAGFITDVYYLVLDLLDNILELRHFISAQEVFRIVYKLHSSLKTGRFRRSSSS